MTSKSKVVSAGPWQVLSEDIAWIANRAEPIFGSATRFSQLSCTLQYSVIGHYKPAEAEC